MWSLFSPPAVQFFDAGPMRDEELSLVAPNGEDAEALLAARWDPATLAAVPELARVTPQAVADFLAAAPAGHYQGNPAAGQSPSYHFWMKIDDAGPAVKGRLAIAGGISLRIGDNSDLRLYVGHIGYNVYPPHRGHHYAERATRLVLPLARRHGMRELWITTNPDNTASRRSCERLGATLVETVDLPPWHDLYARGERRKCRYRLVL